MNYEKGVYKALKWVFSFLTIMMGIASVAIIGLKWVASSSYIYMQSLIQEMPLEGYDFFTSPVLFVLLIGNILLYGIVFFFVRSFFKNLEQENIFVTNNVSTAKIIAVLLLVLSVTTYLPDYYLALNGISDIGFQLELPYIIGAAIVWALAKILEKANSIAEENKMTI